MASTLSDPFSLSGLRVMITGAAGGIGGSAAEVCANLGAALVLADVCDVETIKTRVGPVGKNCEFHSFDTSDRGAVEAAAKTIGSVDAIIDTAAIFPNVDWMSDEFEAALDRVLQVNIKGPLNIARAFLPRMIENKHGRMIFCGSIAGWTGGLLSGPDYAFSKGGLHAFIRWLSRQGAPHNVIVNGVAPSTTRTELVRGVNIDDASFPLGRMAEPREIASALAFLCSPGASYISGAILDVNGGVYLR